MRRRDGGIGRGARGREGTLLALPGGSGLRPGTLGCPARSWLTAWAYVPWPKARPGPEDAAMERRSARTRRHGCPRRKAWIE